MPSAAPAAVGPVERTPARSRAAWQAAVLARPAVAAVDDRVDLERRPLAEAALVADEPTARSGDEVERLGLRRHPVDVVLGLERGRHEVELTRLRPVDGQRIPPGVGQGASRLQAGQDADVVLRGGPPEDHGRSCHAAHLVAVGSGLTGSGRGGHSRTARRRRRGGAREPRSTAASRVGAWWITMSRCTAPASSALRLVTPTIDEVGGDVVGVRSRTGGSPRTGGAPARPSPASPRPPCPCGRPADRGGRATPSRWPGSTRTCCR